MKKKRTCVFILNYWMSIPDMQVSDSLQYHVMGYKGKDYDRTTYTKKVHNFKRRITYSKS